MYPSSCYLSYSWKYWRELNLAIGAQIAIAKNIGGFKFGSSVWDCHNIIYICKYEILADFNLAVARQTAKPPNFPALQYDVIDPFNYNSIFWLL